MLWRGLRRAWASQDRSFRLLFARLGQAAIAAARLTLINDSYTFSCLAQSQQRTVQIEAFMHETALIATFALHQPADHHMSAGWCSARTKRDRSTHGTVPLVV